MAKGMTMYEVSVDITSDGEIVIVQPKHGTDEAVVVLAIEQVDPLIEWLRAIRDTAPGVAKDSDLVNVP